MDSVIAMFAAYGGVLQISGRRLDLSKLRAPTGEDESAMLGFGINPLALRAEDEKTFVLVALQLMVDECLTRCEFDSVPPNIVAAIAQRLLDLWRKAQ